MRNFEFTSAYLVRTSQRTSTILSPGLRIQREVALRALMHCSMRTINSLCFSPSPRYSLLFLNAFYKLHRWREKKGGGIIISLVILSVGLTAHNDPNMIMLKLSLHWEENVITTPLLYSIFIQREIITINHSQKQHCRNKFYYNHQLAFSQLQLHCASRTTPQE